MSSSRRGAKAQQEWREFVASLPAEASCSCNVTFRKFSTGLRNWWAGTGLNRRHQDFRSIPRNRKGRESADLLSGVWIDVIDPDCPRVVLNTLDEDTLWTQLSDPAVGPEDVAAVAVAS